ncbi:biotin transporter BioY [Pelagibacterium sp. 26DY04]|uniref:biotin transporter BioY n=1 Tax=unclassified Pelagibacterium TaxID=2623280 RepID=UPI0028167334|nr:MULTISPECIES: biotin transporter BioY [unclassified Pelagibacterium]WMT87928.1 biotin transporter BioY [Pelagibacterium sp. 26DY04]WMT91303.1 biotin transporter BioY [Pelagibacterium sp. H642]
MATTFATSNTLLGLYQPRSQAARLVSAVAVAFLGSVLLTISAKINVPVWPVPVTLQAMAVAALAAALGARLGVATVALYLVQGLAGLPVFAGAGAGLPYLMGPTGGFILSWLPMAAIIGYAADKGLSRKVVPLFLVMTGAAMLSLVAGFLWLLALSGQAGWIDQSNVVLSAYKGAIEPFVVWDIVKMAFAALTVVGGWALLERK